MRARLLVNVALLLALIGLGLYAYLRPGAKEEPRFDITSLARDSIARIRIERGGNPTIELQKRDGVWQMLTPFTTRADPFQVDRLLDIVQAKSKQKLPPTDLARYDLDPPRLVVTLNDQRFAFGSVNDVTNEQYLATDDAVYVIPPFLGYGVPTDASKLFSRKLLGPNETPTAFDFGKWKLVKNDQGSWKTEGSPPGSRLELSADDINAWAAEWQLASSLATQPYRGKASGEKIEVTLKNGHTFSAEVLSRSPQVVIARSDENMSYQFGADAGARLLDPFRVARSR